MRPIRVVFTFQEAATKVVASGKHAPDSNHGSRRRDFHVSVGVAP
jgi:hypothetical protein